jgi:hypothetical protein
MSKLTRVLIGIFAAIGFAQVAMLTLFFVSSHSGSGCIGGAPLMEVPSPTRAYTATVEIDNCTPTHQLRTTVFLSSGQEKTSVFISGSSALHNAGTFSPLPLRITWLGDVQLEVAYPRGTDLQSRPELTDGVSASYKEFTQYAP